MNCFIRPEPSGSGRHRRDRMRLRFTGAGDNQGNSLKPLGRDGLSIREYALKNQGFFLMQISRFPLI
jgi:hypothetical protein